MGAVLRRSVIIPALLLCASAAAGAETRVMATTMKGQTRTSDTLVRETPLADGLEVIIEDEDGMSRSILDAEGRVLYERVESGQDYLTITSDGQSARISGSWKGKRIEVARDLKGCGFYGCRFEFALRAMIERGLDSMRFVMVHREDPSDPAVMDLRLDGRESYNGGEATRIKITLTGVLSHFWNARFLVDDRGRILRFSGNKGPGTSSMLIELVDVRP